MKLLILASIALLALADKKKSLANGFRDEIDWVDYNQAVGVAKDLNKPIFFLIHKTWCGACKGLQREFKSSGKFSELLELSKKFVMVNVEDDQEPEDEKYAPDGGYIPRILFLDTDSNPMKTNNEQKYKNNKYFYPLIVQIIDGMERALLEYEGLATQEKKTDAAKPKAIEEKEEEGRAVEEEKEEETETAAEETTQEEKEEAKEEEVKEKKKKSDKKDKKADDKDEL